MRELRLLAAHAPPYNRRSKFPHRWWWVVLTDEAFPRFSVVRAPKHDRAVGPFRVPRRRGRDRRAAGPIHRRAHLHHAAGPLGAARAVLPRTRAVARARRRATSTAAEYAAAPPRAAALIAGADGRAAARGARPRRRPGRARPLRDRRPAARPRRHRDRRAVARPAAARAGRRRRAGGRPAGRRAAAGNSR